MKEGLASFDPSGNCQKLLDFYNNSEKTTQFPLDPELVALIQSIKIKSPPEAPNVRLLGDELADRGKNDGITIQLLKKLDAAQPRFQIMMSNHSIEFLREMSGLTNDVDIYGQSTSSHPIMGIKNKESKTSAEIAALDEVNAFIRDTYLKHLKLVSVTPQTGTGPVVFTHAPTDPAGIFLAVHALGLATGNCDSVKKLEMNIGECSELINTNYLNRVRTGLANPENPDNILARNRENDPIGDLFWKRHSSDWARNNGSWQTANGHDKGTGSSYELDNDLGKGNGNNSGVYQVLLPY